MKRVSVTVKKRRGASTAEKTRHDPIMAIRKNAEGDQPTANNQASIRYAGRNEPKHKRLTL